MAVDRGSQPFYDSSTEEYHNKNYRQILFTSGRAVQCRELTGIGNYATEHIKDIAGLLYKDGTILSGCNVKAMDATPRTGYADALSGLTVGTLTMNGGKIFIDGYPFEIEFTKFPAYSKSVVPIRLTGTETIYVEIIDTVVTAVEDDTLLDPAEGYDNYEAPGAHRLQRIARYISTSHKDYNVTRNIRIPVVEIVDGKITYEAATTAVQNESDTSVSSETSVLDLLSQRTFETSGNYLVNGYRVKTAISPDNTKIGVTVTPGVAYINGNRYELQSAFTGYIDKILVTSSIQGEEHAVEYEDDGTTIKRRYQLNMSPASTIDEVAVPIVGKRQLQYNKAAISYITGLGGSINKVLHCYCPMSAEPGEGSPDQLPTEYYEFTEGVDFKFQNQGILWLSTGDNPTSKGFGTAFYVVFLYKPNLTSDKYHVEFSSTKETTLRLALTNGVATIPDEFINPVIKTVKNPYVPTSDDYQELTENRQWYQQGNKLYVGTKSSPTIPIMIPRGSNTSSDSIGMSGAAIKTVKMYSESGVEYYRMYTTYEAKPDYRFYGDSGVIEWLDLNKPNAGEAYIAEVELPSSVYTDFGSNQEVVLVNFTYETESQLYSNTVHDSYLVIHDDVNLYRSTGGGDNITLSYEIARSRTTSVCLDSDGKIAFYHGTVIDQYNNLWPTVPSSSLVITDLFVKPTTSSDCYMTEHNNYRMRMTDLRDMFNRLKDVEYNISLNDLEQEAESKMAGQTLRGVFTDAFTSLRKSDNSLIWSFINDVSNQALPLVTEGKLSPNYKKYALNLTINTTATTAGLYDNIYLLSKNFTTEQWISQTHGTIIRSAAEGLDMMECFPTFSIDPDNDQFIENEVGVIETPNDSTVKDILDAEEVESNSLIKKVCYVFNGDAASLISDGSLSLPTAKNSVVTVQFWMYLDTDKNCMPFSFNGTGTPRPLGANFLITKDYAGVNTYNSDIAGIPNEELKGYWRLVTCMFKCKADKATEMDLYINTDRQKVSAYSWSGGKYNANNMIFGDKIRISGSFYNENGFSFKGKICDIRLWNRALTLDEIKKTITDELKGNESGLIGWWKNLISADQVEDSCLNGSTRHPLKVAVNGGFSTNTAGTVSYETRSFAEIVTGQASSSLSSTAVIKNVVDLTAGNVPDEQIDIVLDPTKNSITYKGSSIYVTQDVNAGAQKNTSQLGGVTFDAYNVEKTWYEKVVTQQDQILGEFVTDISSVSTLRRRVITVKGAGFLENTDLISITFDGVPVQLYQTADWNEEEDGSASNGSTHDRYWKTNENGEFRCAFVIPENIPIGVREVKLTAPGNIELKAQYWGAGIKASKLTLTQSNEVITWEPRTAIIGQQYLNQDGWVLVDGWSCRSRCGTTPLCQTFYVNDSSLTRPVKEIQSKISTNSDVFLTSADVYFRTAGDCPDVIAGFVELTDSGVPRSDSGAGPSRFVGGVQVFPTSYIGTGVDLPESPTIGETGGYVSATAGDPARGTAKTTVRWTNLVQLKGGKGYGFIVGSTDGNTTMWCASIENSSKNTDYATGESITSEEQTDRGVLLSSPNGQTWAVYHYEDLKYTLNIANFFSDPKLVTAPASMSPAKTATTGKISYVEYNPVDISSKSSGSLSAMNFFMYEVNAQNSNDGSGYITYEYAYENEVTGNWSDWLGFTPGTTVYLDNAIKKIKIRAALYSFNPYSSPILSKEACLTCGQFILPTTYTSITANIGTWNVAEVYLDKFFDENLSTVDLYVSPDQGYTWKKMERAVDLTPIYQTYARYNGEAINQYHYRMKLELEAPTIESITVSTNGSAGDFEGATGTWEFGVALVDAYGNESPLSNLMQKDISGNRTNLTFKVKFNPNATGFRIYARQINETDTPYLFYDSTAEAYLFEALENTSTGTSFKVGEGGQRFPTSGTVLIDGEYIRYNSLSRSEVDGEAVYTFSGSNFSRGITHNGRESTVAAHTEGSVVQLVNEGYLQQDSPTACTSGLWRFPAYTMDSNFDWHFTFVAKNALHPLRATYLKDVTPSLDEDVPGNFTSEYATFRVEMRDNTGATVVDTMDRVPGAGRVILTCGYEAY